MKTMDHYAIQRLIGETLTLDELGAVCTHLGIDIEQIPGRGLLAKAFGIVPYMAEQGRIAELFHALSTYKPSIFSEYSLTGPDVPVLDRMELSLIEVPPEEAATRVVQLHVSDPQAELLLQQIEKLQERVAVLADPLLQRVAYDALEEASRILWGNPEKVDDWPLQMNRAQFLCQKVSAIVYRAEKLQDKRRAEVDSIIEDEKKRALEERRLTWLVPLAVLFYALLTAGLGVVAFFYMEGNYTVPILGIPLPIVVWSAIGSLSALLYRYYRREMSSAMVSEVRILIGRFWIGVVAGCIFYFTIRSGLFVLSDQTVDLNEASSGLQQAFLVLVWVVAFSDFIFERVIARISGNVIGEEDDRAVSSVSQVTASEIASIVRSAGNEQLAEMRRLRAELRIGIQNPEGEHLELPPGEHKISEERSTPKDSAD